MKTISTGTPSFVPNILNENGGVKEWQERSSSFDDFLRHVRFVSYCNNESDVSTVCYMVDLLYKIESEVGKVNVEVKAIIDVKWNKRLDELNTITGATWPYIEIDIVIWEVMVGIKTLPFKDSD